MQLLRESLFRFPETTFNFLVHFTENRGYCKGKEEKLDEMTKELATALENMSKKLREAKLNAIGSLAKSIEQLRDEINLLHEKKKLIQRHRR